MLRKKFLKKPRNQIAGIGMIVVQAGEMTGTLNWEVKY